MSPSYEDREFYIHVLEDPLMSKQAKQTAERALKEVDAAIEQRLTQVFRLCMSTALNRALRECARRVQVAEGLSIGIERAALRLIVAYETLQSVLMNAGDNPRYPNGDDWNYLSVRVRLCNPDRPV